MSLGKKIKELRESNNKTQLDVSKYLGVTYQTIYKYEKDIAIPPADAIVKLAEYFGVTTDYLLGRTENDKLVQDIDKKMHDNDIVIAANSKVDLGKLAKADSRITRMINILLDDFENDDDEEEE